MSRRWSVAMIAAMPYPSGQGTQALVSELARGLAGRGHRVHLVCYHHAAFDREEPFQVHRIRSVPFYQRLRSGPDAIKPVLDLLLAARSASVIRHEDCRLVHAHNYEGALAGWAAARTCGVPLVYHAHNVMEDELPRYFESSFLGRAARAAGAGLDRFVPRLADRVLALHDRLAERLREAGVDSGRIDVVAPGIEVGFWGTTGARRDARPTVVYAGNLDGYQDLPVLLAAMRVVEHELPGSRLLLATPNDIREAGQLARGHGAEGCTEVVWTPDAAAARSALARAWVAASPRSSWSGFPVKNLNAQAAGLPVVACRGSAVGFVPNETGLVVPDGDAAAFASALLVLLRDPERARSMGASGRRFVEEHHARGNMITGVERTWQRLGS